MLVRSRIPYLAIRILTCAIWAGISVGYAYLQFYHPNLPLFNSENLLPFGVVALLSPILGFIVTISHPRSSRKATILSSVVWSLCQIVIGIILSVCVCAAVAGRIRLFEIGETILWAICMLVFNPIVLGVVWLFAFFTQLMLCFFKDPEKWGEKGDGEEKVPGTDVPRCQ